MVKNIPYYIHIQVNVGECDEVHTRARAHTDTPIFIQSK